MTAIVFLFLEVQKLHVFELMLILCTLVIDFPIDMDRLDLNLFRLKNFGLAVNQVKSRIIVVWNAL